MGWWKANSRGGIDGSFQSQSGMLNAVAGDSPEHYYNGDGPANIVCGAIHGLKILTGKAQLSSSDLLNLLLHREVGPVFENVNRDVLLSAVEIMWSHVDNEYQEAWGRPAYPEEKEAICTFVLL